MPTKVVERSSAVSDECRDLASQLAIIDSKLIEADREIEATAAEAELAKAQWGQAARFYGSAGARREEPNAQRASQAVADALRAKASLLGQRDDLITQLHGARCPGF